MPRCVCLVPLCRCPNPKIATLTFRLLSNLAQCLCQRVYLATPFINVALGRSYRSHEQIQNILIWSILDPGDLC